MVIFLILSNTILIVQIKIIAKQGIGKRALLNLFLFIIPFFIWFWNSACSTKSYFYFRVTIWHFLVEVYTISTCKEKGRYRRDRKHWVCYANWLGWNFATCPAYYGWPYCSPDGLKKYFRFRPEYYLLPAAAVGRLAGNCRLSLFGLMHPAAASWLK